MKFFVPGKPRVSSRPKQAQSSRRFLPGARQTPQPSSEWQRLKSTGWKTKTAQGPERIDKLVRDIEYNQSIGRRKTAKRLSNILYFSLYGGNHEQEVKEDQKRIRNEPDITLISIQGTKLNL